MNSSITDYCSCSVIYFLILYRSNEAKGVEERLYVEEISQTDSTTFFTLFPAVFLS